MTPADSAWLRRVVYGQVILVCSSDSGGQLCGVAWHDTREVGRGHLEAVAASVREGSSASSQKRWYMPCSLTYGPFGSFSPHQKSITWKIGRGQIGCGMQC
eukprot:COSAG02_NODE_12794_length_1492_cov_0.929648_1_plen_100_part_10